MTTIASASDDKITVITSDKGVKGDSGTDGTDGLGFNFVRGGLINSPLLSCLKPNAFTLNGAGAISWVRDSNAYGFNRYGEFATAAADTPRQEADGWLIETQRENLLLNSETLSSQDVTVTAQEYTLSFYGAGSIALSGVEVATLSGTGADDRVSLTFTPSAGTLTLTVSGSVTKAQLEAGGFATSYIVTTGATATREADQVSITAGGNVPLLADGYTVAMNVKLKAVEDSVTLLSLPDDVAITTSVANGLTVTHGATSINASVSSDTLYRLLVTYDGSTLTVYVNGVQQGQQIAPSVNGTDENGSIAVGDNFNGWISELSLYDFSFNASEAQLLGE